MKTLKEFIEKVAKMWPKMTEEQKDKLCNGILEGNIFALNKILKQTQKELLLNENKTN